ncbi:Uncharacterised protein [Serratia plymuthica]|nr:Uncharacterised protein [Serratia plymuthica]VEI15698.1 Uncharacterised protein [Serratia plymuthica]
MNITKYVVFLFLVISSVEHVNAAGDRSYLYNMSVDVDIRPFTTDILALHILDANSNDSTAMDCRSIFSIRMVYSNKGTTHRFSLMMLGPSIVPLNTVVDAWKKQLPQSFMASPNDIDGPCFWLDNGSISTTKLGCYSFGGGGIPSPISCTLNGDISLAYGVINSEAMNGLVKAAMATISCTDKATVPVNAKLSSGAM